MSRIGPLIDVPIRKALLANYTLMNELPRYLGQPPIFTRRPVPPNVPYPMIVISEDLNRTDTDGIADQRPIITKDVSIYGQNDTADHHEQVMSLGVLVFDIFHRKRDSIYIPDPGWYVVSISCTGPISGPVDDDLFAARVITIRTQLAASL